ncbi:Hypothetical Protein SLY_1124 [Strawberry lethal yellows phytoplasma (CPA) str. NZSb11]|uniref:Uncharacterized protein n=1 Tax=Strawberry lethal yellows phytoplasma (CPA) str. NZSb11 TaxID=980422 RepID=R4RNS7_PHYAS|nr:Hypothetical Protein SLY_1124 [Strawberry lethal yellows phytoplasma (CPA) str. NZSb11]
MIQKIFFETKKIIDNFIFFKSNKTNKFFKAFFLFVKLKP